MKRKTQLSHLNLDPHPQSYFAKYGFICMSIGDNNEHDHDQDAEGSLATIDRVETPKMFRVIILNDDFTPMDFVVYVLQRFFGKSTEEATKIMLDVHKRGAGTAGVYTEEVAEMKSLQVNEFAKQNRYPLKSTVEEAP